MLPGSSPMPAAIETVGPGRTYALHYDDGEEGRIYGSADGADALRQAIFLRLSVERGKFLIYSRSYGTAFAELLGKPVSLAVPEIRYRIEEALLQDDRIESLSDFDFTVRAGRVTCTFTVNSIYGRLSMEKEVTV